MNWGRMVREVGLLILVGGIVFGQGAWGQYDDGDGSAEFPYEIAEPNQLIYMSEHPEDWDQHFILTADINLALADPNIFTTALIAPDMDNSTVWYQGTAFTGVFDGNDHTIFNLTIDDAGEGNDYLSLFGRIYGGAEIKNLGLNDVDITGGNGSRVLGGLCGENRGVITNCFTTGKVTGGSGSWYMGGLCGYQLVSINNCYSTVRVNGGGGSRRLGGLCGYNNEGIISNCYATGSVTGGYNPFYLGGLCGYNNEGIISNCYAIGVVNGGEDSIDLGGLCGSNEDGTINNGYFYVLSGLDNGLGTALDDLQMQDATSFVGFDFAEDPNDGVDDYWTIVDGHCPKLTWQTDDGPVLPDPPATTLAGSGFAYDPFQINSYADFTEFRTNNSLLCGYYILHNDIDLSSETFTTAIINRLFGGHFDGDGHVISNINIDTTGASNVNFGLFRKIITSVSNLGIENIYYNVGGDYSRHLGGLCGWNDGIITNCYTTGVVTGGDDYNNLGGLCGLNRGTITNCYATCEVNGGNDSENLGGLCGYNKEGTISECYATGSVSAEDNSLKLGGLCGDNGDQINPQASITNCYATGSVTGGSYVDDLGGLCGYNKGTITNSYATGSIIGDWYARDLGGLCGYNSDSTISNCYATGSVTGGNYSAHLGGLCGDGFDGAIINCFWDAETGGPDNGIGTPLTNSEMKQQNSFSGWDFDPHDGDPADWFMQLMSYPKQYWQKTIEYCGVTEVTLAQGDLDTVQIHVYSLLDETLHWTLTNYNSCSWITGIDPDSGNSSGQADQTTVTIEIDSLGLSEGDYTCELALDPNIGDSIAVSILLHVYKPVGVAELAHLAQYWLMTGCEQTQPCSAADWYIDENINMLDFNQLALSWLRKKMILYSDFIAYWTLNETTGNIAHDSAMYGLDGSLQGDALWTAGHIDNAVSLDGEGDYIDLGNSDFLKPPLPITFSVWIKLTSLTDHQVIISLDTNYINDTDGDHRFYGPELLMFNTGEVAIAYGDGQPDYSMRYKIGTTPLSTDTWYHLAGVICGPDDMDIYINGVNDGGIPEGTGGPMTYLGGPAYLGCRNGSVFYMHGLLDEVRIYPRALSESEIQILASE